MLQISHGTIGSHWWSKSHLRADSAPVMKTVTGKIEGSTSVVWFPVLISVAWIILMQLPALSSLQVVTLKWIIDHTVQCVSAQGGWSVILFTDCGNAQSVPGLGIVNAIPIILKNLSDLFCLHTHIIRSILIPLIYIKNSVVLYQPIY